MRGSTDPIPPCVPPLERERLEAVLDRMQADLGNAELGVDQLAAIVGLSPFHFSRRFKAATGTPAHLYLVQLRVARAKELLGSTSHAIDEIARACGFATVAQFSASFRRHAGMAPAEFRVGGSSSGNQPGHRPGSPSP